MKAIYFDNGSTSFPKPPAVAEAVYAYMTQLGCNIQRGGYKNAYRVEETVYETRQMLTELFHGPAIKCVAFTKNVTESLNVILKGFLQPGDHVITTSMEHNAVMRPLGQLEKHGISVSRIPCGEDGSLRVEDALPLLQKNTKAVVMTHASNVCGTLLPVLEMGAFCQRNGLRFIVDSAQTAGVCPIDMEQMHIDALAFTGHKGLLGPQGIGGFILQEDMIEKIEPLLSGGTGSISHREDVPAFMPDRFEPGTMNLPGIVGLHASLGFLRDTGIDRICAHERLLTERFLAGLDPMAKDGRITVCGRPNGDGRIGVVSLTTCGQDVADVAYRLDEAYGVMTRVGLHCAPAAHKTLGTYPTGTIRFSFGWWNTQEEVDTALTALAALTCGR